MNDLWFKTLLSGVLFGIWPLLMNKSKLNGSVSAAVFCGVAFLTVLPFAIKGLGGTIPEANWRFAILAAVVAGLALLSFNDMLAKATPENLSAFFVVNLLAQIAAPALYQAYVTRGLSFNRGAGFATAALAAYFLTRPH